MILKNKTTLSDVPISCRTVLNFSLPPENVPTLIPAKALEVLVEGDAKPYFVVEEILDYKALANGIEYTREFWESYISKLNAAPIPGAKSGHTDPWNWWESGESDLFVVGGEISGDSIRLKMYIPPMGQSSSNETFIKAVKSGVVHFSIVTWPEMSVDYDEEGNAISKKAVKSVKGERNDAVERDMGAMDQRVNIKNNPGENNRDKNNNKTEGLNMPEITLDEIITNLSNRLTNGSLSVLHLAEKLNISVVTDVHMNAVRTVDEIKKIVGENPIEAISEMKKNAAKVEKQGYENDRDKALTAAFGPEKIKVNNEERENLVRTAASPYVSVEIQSADDLKKQIEEAKKNPVVLNLQKQKADVFSDENLISEPGAGAVVNANSLGNDQFVKL